jgi:RNA polymerase sigma factor (sigma-70 family)
MRAQIRRLTKVPMARPRKGGGLQESAGSALLDAYLERRPDLVRFFTVRLKSAAAAEDLVQDIYVRLTTVDPDAEIQNPAAYIYRLGSNLMLDRIRGERRAAVREASWKDANQTVMGPDEISEEPNAEQRVAARQQLDLVVAALSEMSAQTQRVFRMHKFDGMSHPEVASALGISRSAVEKHVMAALKHLSERLR